MKRPAKLIRDRSGAAVVEFAILAPVALLMLFGTYEITSMLVAYMKLIDAVDVVCDLASQQNIITTASLNDFYTAEQLIMAPLNTNGLGLAIASVTFNAQGTGSLAWQQTFGGAAAMTDAVTGAQTLSNPNWSVIVAQATYTYNSPLKYVLHNGITLTERVYTKPRVIGDIPLN
jgi:Flp pilus assembly protein TadG